MASAWRLDCNFNRCQNHHWKALSYYLTIPTERIHCNTKISFFICIFVAFNGYMYNSCTLRFFLFVFKFHSVYMFLKPIFCTDYQDLFKTFKVKCFHQTNSLQKKKKQFKTLLFFCLMKLQCSLPPQPTLTRLRNMFRK